MYRFTIPALLLLASTTCLAQQLSKEEKDEGFVSLFNGKDLSGWKGVTKRYAVDDGGTLYCKTESYKFKIETLFTEREYGDFVLRLRYLLTENTNNGVGLRMDPKKLMQSGPRAHIADLEIQLADDKHAAERKYKPEQLSGALYGLKAAVQGVQRPAEKWNSMEIVAKGPKLQVNLNGERILDADLTEFRNAPAEVRQMRGPIGLVAHTGRVEFKNIRIKELK